MTDSVEKAACSGPGILTIGGRTFVVPPIPAPDALALQSEFRRQCIAEAKDPLTLANERISAAEKAGRPLSPTVVNAMVTAAMSATSRPEAKSEPSEEEILARVNTLEGSRTVLFYRLRRVAPDVTMDWVRSVMPDMDARNEVFAALAEVDGTRQADAKKASASG